MATSIWPAFMAAGKRESKPMPLNGHFFIAHLLCHGLDKIHVKARDFPILPIREFKGAKEGSVPTMSSFFCCAASLLPEFPHPERLVTTTAARMPVKANFFTQLFIRLNPSSYL